MSAPGEFRARAYFALQGGLGLAWSVAVFFHGGLRASTLGEADPRFWIPPDLVLFTLPSVLAARWPAPSVRLTAALFTLLTWTGFVLAVFGWRSLDGGRGAWGVIGMACAFTGSTLAGIRLAQGPLGAGACFPLPLRIRPAPEASAFRHLAVTGVQIVIFWGLFLGVFPRVITLLEVRWNLGWPPLSSAGVALAGWVLFTTQSLLGLWSAFEMVTRGRGTPLPSETARRLVTSGPYAIVRNPMAVAGILQGLAVGLILGSWLVVAYALTGSVVWNTLARPYEEADLRDRFGEEFEAYRRRVRCWIPGLGRSRAG